MEAGTGGASASGDTASAMVMNVKGIFSRVLAKAQTATQSQVPSGAAAAGGAGGSASGSAAAAGAAAGAAGADASASAGAASVVYHPCDGSSVKLVALGPGASVSTYEGSSSDHMIRHKAGEYVREDWCCPSHASWQKHRLQSPESSSSSISGGAGGAGESEAEWVMLPEDAGAKARAGGAGRTAAGGGVDASAGTGPGAGVGVGAACPLDCGYRVILEWSNRHAKLRSKEVWYAVWVCAILVASR